MGMILALISGALMSIQGVWNTAVTRRSGVWLAAGFVQLTAFLFCLILYLAGVGGREPVRSLWQAEPRYSLFGGVLGALITYTVICSVEKLGPAGAALLIVVSQIIVAYGIELFGLFGAEKAPFQWQKLIGAGVAILGIVIFQWGQIKK